MRLFKPFLLMLTMILIMSLVACGGGVSESASGGKGSVSAPSGGNSGGSASAGGANSSATSSAGPASSASGGGAPASSGADAKSGDSGGAFEFGLDFIEKNLKGSYHIVYDITAFSDGEEDSISMEQIWTPEGFYFASNGDGMLFIKNGEVYDVYADSGDGEFEKLPMTYPKDMAEAMVAGITGYMTTYASFADSLERDGSETVAGRDCEKYNLDFTHPMYNSKFKYTYSIDKATGVCLKFKMDLLSDGKKIGYEFVCSEFKTSGVSLPKYK